MGWGFSKWIGVIAAVCLGGPLASAQSPEPIDLPDPKRMVLSARQVANGELIVYDPVVVRFGATRVMPDAVPLPRHRRVAVRARMDSIYVALPLRKRTIVSARMDSIDIAVPDLRGLTTSARMDHIDIAIPDPHGLTTAAWMDSIVIPPLDDPAAIGVALAITAADLEMPATHSMSAVIMRYQPEVVLITEPLVMSTVIQRPVPQVQAHQRE